MKHPTALLLTVALTFATHLHAQRGPGRGPRSSGDRFQPTDVAFESQVSISIQGDRRIIRANGVPDHQTGQFPNNGNTHRIVSK